MSDIRGTGTPDAMARPSCTGGNRSRLMKACRQIEGLFLSQLMQTMDRPAFGEGMLGSSRATSLFRSRRNQVIADEMGMRGDLGLARILYDDLSHETDAAGETDEPGDSHNTPTKGAAQQ